MATLSVNDPAERLDTSQGITVAVTPADPGFSDPEDVVIFIDTDLPPTRRIRIRINDALIFVGTPGHGVETVHEDRFEGFYIRQEVQP